MEKDRLTSLAQFQTSIIQHAMTFPLARRIVYSTCSVHAQENERVVEAILASNSNFILAPRSQVLPTWSTRGEKQSQGRLTDGRAQGCEDGGTKAFSLMIFPPLPPLPSLIQMNWSLLFVLIQKRIGPMGSLSLASSVVPPPFPGMWMQGLKDLENMVDPRKRKNQAHLNLMTKSMRRRRRRRRVEGAMILWNPLPQHPLLQVLGRVKGNEVRRQKRSKGRRPGHSRTRRCLSGKKKNSSNGRSHILELLVPDIPSPSPPPEVGESMHLFLTGSLPYIHIFLNVCTYTLSLFFPRHRRVNTRKEALKMPL